MQKQTSASHDLLNDIQERQDDKHRNNVGFFFFFIRPLFIVYFINLSE